MTTRSLDATLYKNEEFERRLAHEVERAAKGGRPYAVLAFTPQHLPGESVSDAIDVAIECVRRLLRSDDLVGSLDGEIVAVGLRETDGTEAGIFAHRVQGDLRLRSARLRNTVWEAGIAILPQDGATAAELFGNAVHEAKTRRRRLGML